MARKRKRKRKNPASPIGVVAVKKPDAPADKDPSRVPVWLRPALAVALILVSGVIYGLQTNRWSASEDVQKAAAKLKDVPATLGDWESTDSEIPERQLKIAGAAGYVSRVYRNRIDGRQVHVMMLCGPHGPISLHPPTVCFTGAGWKTQNLKKQAVEYGTEKSSGQFQVGRFQRQSSSGKTQMTTFWAWNSDGAWQCPDRPRFAFAGVPHLYKLYVSVIGPATEEADTKQTETSVAFLRLLLPALQKAGI